MSQPGRSSRSDRITVNVFGSVICLVMLLAIVREMYRSYRFSGGQIHLKDTEDVYAVVGDIEKRIT